MPRPYLTSTILAFCLFLCTRVSAQNTLSGRVVDGVTKEPIAFATVYLDGTSTGEVTDDDGTFRLRNFRLPAIMVVSHLSYETKYVELREDGAVGDLFVRPREAVITGVEVVDRNQRRKTLAEFTRLLLGRDEWAQKSAILNDEVIYFDRDYRERTLTVKNERMRARLAGQSRPGARWSEDNTRYTYGKATNLKAQSRGLMKVRLPHLGYTLSMDLKSFRTDYVSGQTAHLGTYYFAEDERITAQQRRNRERAYYGSGKHFAHALLTDSLTENGFRVYAVAKGEELNQRKVAEVNLRTFLVPTDGGGGHLVGLKDREFAILYYADDNYRPLPEKRWKRATPVQSRLTALANKCLLVKGGVFGDANLLFNGDIGKRSLAWALPAEYVIKP